MYHPTKQAQFMDRREFLTSYTDKATAENDVFLDKNEVFSDPPLPSSGLNTYTGTWSDTEVILLLKRTMFGAKKADIDYFKSK